MPVLPPTSFLLSKLQYVSFLVIYDAFQSFNIIYEQTVKDLISKKKMSST